MELFGVENYGFSGFDFFMPGNMGMHWNSEIRIGEARLFSGEKQEKPRDFVSAGKKQRAETKNTAASRSHCETERRRRERINAHFTILRNFVPDADKMDKATLLAEVIKQVKLLKKQATEATKGLVIPTDTDEVTVEICNHQEVPDGLITLRACLCCNYKEELIPKIRQALEAFNVTLSRPEISTLGSRVKSVFIITMLRGEIGNKKLQKFARAIRDALNSVLEKFSSFEELLVGETYLNKKRKVSSSSNLCSPS